MKKFLKENTEELLIETNQRKNEGYKQTKLGWIPESWEVKSLGELGDVLSGLTYSPKDVVHSGTLVLRSSNVQEDRLSFNDNVYVDTSKLKYNEVKKDDILICVRNGSKSLIGKNASISEEVEGVAFGAFMSIYRSEYSNFLKHYFKTELYYREIHKNLGATINSINGSNLKKFQVPFPPLPEQQKIYSILNTWDKAIAAQEQLIAKKQELKKGLMQQLLTGKKRFAGFEGEWEKIRFTDFSELFHGFQFRKEHFVENGYPVIKIGSLVDSKGLTMNNATYISEETAKNFAKFRLYKGDVLMALTGGTLGKVAIVEKDYGKVFQNYRVGKFIPKKNCTKAYLSQLLQSFYVQQRVKSLVNEAAQPNFGKQDFDKIWIPLPPIKEQDKIASFLIKIDKEVSAISLKLKELKKQKQGLMQQLLTGAKRVKQ